MGIGDFNTNERNNSKKLFESTYYSRLRFKNPNSNLALGFTFKSGLLVIEISQLDSSNGFNYTSLQSINVSPTKAKIFAGQIETFKEYYKEGNITPGRAFGINAGMGEKVSYIGIHADTNKDIFVTIGKIDNEGQILEHSTFTMNRNYHYGLEWNDINAMSLVKTYYDNIELDQFHDIVNQFANYMNGAIAYSAFDLGRYEINRLSKKIDPIYDKLGIERYNSNGNKGGTNNFLNNAGTNSNHISSDDIDELFS